MEPVTSEIIHQFLERLGAAYHGEVKFYLLGGSALFLLGNPRGTLDIDYTYEIDAGGEQEFEKVVNQLGQEMRLYLESVPLGEFIPLPPGVNQRSRRIGRFGNVVSFNIAKCIKSRHYPQ